MIPKLPKHLVELNLALTNSGEIKTKLDDIFLLTDNL